MNARLLGVANSILSGSLLALASLFIVFPAQAAVINFDEFAATNNNTALTNTYVGQGVVFGATNAGTQSGLDYGDPGNWGLRGTNGSQFLGFNGVWSQTVTFSTPLSFFSADFSPAYGSIDGTIFMQAFNGATLVGSISAILGTHNSWTTLSLIAPTITSIQWDAVGTAFHPYGVDNLVYNQVPVPSVGAGLPGLVLAFGGLLGWWRKRNAP